MSSSSEYESYIRTYPLHDAAEIGDIKLLLDLLRRETRLRVDEDDSISSPEVTENSKENLTIDSGVATSRGSNDDDDEDEDGTYTPSVRVAVININQRDRSGATALHTAFLFRNLDAVEVLLEEGADPNLLFEGSSLAHLVLSIGAIPKHAEFSYHSLRLLMQNRINATVRDGNNSTLLHLAAQNNLPDCLELLLAGEGNGDAEQDAEADCLSESSFPSLRDLIDSPDRQAQRPIHLAARYGHIECTQMLLKYGSSLHLPTILGDSALHYAMSNSHWEISRLILAENPDLIRTNNRRNLNPLEVALKKGLIPPKDILQLMGMTKVEQEEEIWHLPTLILKHELCERHRSCPPFRRSGPEPPPENSRRLEVIYDTESGVLRTGEFSELEWEENPPRAQLADVMRVHEYEYVNKLETLCKGIPDSPTAIKHLDGDTAVSRDSYEAAFRAAGSVCEAVDRVCGKGNERKNRNAFCAVRPPGHHAGPRGLVTCSNDPDGSHGFCLLNNVAIGAAYARHMHRGPNGIVKVAIIDFDVHHGNGTEAIIRGLLPSEIRAEINSPFCTGVIRHSELYPWLSEDDVDNCFFVSVHGYGKKDATFEGMKGGWFYPGSGVNCYPPSFPQSTSNKSCADKPNGEESDEHNEDTADGSFDSPKSNGDNKTRTPLILDLGLPIMRPEDGRLNWRNEYRRVVLPALVDFNPDLIMVSAGFDAHYKEIINFGYIGLVEDDYEWITAQLVQIANLCCDGRLISVLEGGYSINGGPISAFGRSVACHVRALHEGTISRQIWMKEESEWETEFESSLLAARKQHRREKRLERKLAKEENKHPAKDVPKLAELNNSTLPEADDNAQKEVDMDSRRKRPRRSSEPVDYVALAAKFLGPKDPPDAPCT